jgi:hypothetical protein
MAIQDFIYRKIIPGTPPRKFILLLKDGSEMTLDNQRNIDLYEGRYSEVYRLENDSSDSEAAYKLFKIGK